MCYLLGTTNEHPNPNRNRIHPVADRIASRRSVECEEVSMQETEWICTKCLANSRAGCNCEKPDIIVRNKKQPTMKIELNKTYRTRGNNKARVICIDRKGGIRPIIALIAECEGEESCRNYSEDGKCGESRVFPSNHDLVAEWVDKPVVDWSFIPPWFNWVAMDHSGRWCAFISKPDLTPGKHAWARSVCCEEVITIPEQWHPTYAVMNVEGSLTQRP